MTSRTALAPWALAATLAGAVALGGCADRVGGGDRSPSTTVERTTVVEAPAAQRSATEFDPQRIHRLAGPGVVTVIATQSGDTQRTGVGSGFVVSSSGEIATNAHVVTTGEGSAIRRADSVFVRFPDRNEVEARIVGFDPFVDVALLRVEPDGLDLSPLRLGSVKALRVGAPVIAIGSPFGEEGSLSVGVISAVDRSIRSLTGFDTPDAIQTDAAINRGNSGGPLLDGEGRVIGINSQIETETGQGSGVGFAVPIDAVRRSLDQLRRDGRARYAYLGVASVDVYPQLAERFSLGETAGAWVQELTPDSPAARGGVRGGSGQTAFHAQRYAVGGDVIVSFDGQPVRGAADLASLVASSAPGRAASLGVMRDGRRTYLRITLGERPLQAPRPG